MCVISEIWDAISGQRAQTIWTAIQALGVPIALWAAIMLPKINADRQKMEDAVGYRNIAMFNCRMMKIMCEKGGQNETWLIDLNAYESCLRRLHLVPIERIGFATISQTLAHIDVLVTKGLMILTSPPVDWGSMEKLTDEAYTFLRFVDAFLIANRCTLAEDGSPDPDLVEAPPLQSCWIKRWFPETVKHPKPRQNFSSFPSDRQRDRYRAAKMKILKANPE